MFEISRMYEFAAAHRIMGHPKCGRLHGHNYRVEVVLAGEELPQDGMLMDYGKLDEIVKPLIECMDHHYLAAADEDFTSTIQDRFNLHTEHSTAESIALLIYQTVRTHTGLVKEVSVWETPRSKATFRP